MSSTPLVFFPKIGYYIGWACSIISPHPISFIGGILKSYKKHQPSTIWHSLWLFIRLVGVMLVGGIVDFRLRVDHRTMHEASAITLLVLATVTMFACGLYLVYIKFVKPAEIPERYRG